MAQLIRVPELGIAIANVTIVEWMVKEGEQVSRGDALLEVLTDKMVMEVPAEASGTLRKILFQAKPTPPSCLPTLKIRASRSGAATTGSIRTARWSRPTTSRSAISS